MKFIVLSDCHRGDGSPGDEFAHNSLLYKCALEHYHAEGYTYIELGDAEDLWEIDDFEQIYITHTSIYDLLRKFHDPDPRKTRYIKVWGNHDEYWKDHAEVLQGLFPGIRVYEAVVLGNILMLHGHQADTTCTGPGGKISKFLVRHLWSGLQKFGMGPALFSRREDGSLPILQFGKTDSAPALPTPPFTLIAGHTHRPVFANLSQTEQRFRDCGVGLQGTKAKDPDPAYYNTGSCVHPRCITGLEIEYKKSTPAFTLVKWSEQADAVVRTADGCKIRPLAIARSVLES